MFNVPLYIIEEKRKQNLSSDILLNHIYEKHFGYIDNKNNNTDINNEKITNIKTSNNINKLNTEIISLQNSLENLKYNVRRLYAIYREANNTLNDWWITPRKERKKHKIYQQKLDDYYKKHFGYLPPDNKIITFFKKCLCL